MAQNYLLNVPVLNSESGTNCNCFILIFLTHGSLNNELVVNDGSIFVDEVWEKLGKCKKLKNVPKLLLIQVQHNHNLV